MSALPMPTGPGAARSFSHQQHSSNSRNLQQSHKRQKTHTIVHTSSYYYSPGRSSANLLATTTCLATGRRSSSSSSMTPLPKVVAFDLDGTLWWPEMYMLNGGAPFKRDKNGNVYDRSGERIDLLGSSRAILAELATDPKWKGTKVAYVSRTEYPEWAIPCLKTILVADGISMFDVSEYQEIYPGSKRQHFKVIHQQSGISYDEMVFFDNERWNITDCSPLGITCVYTPDGMTDSMWQQGLKKYAEARTKAGSVQR